MEFRYLGPVEVAHDGRLLPLTGKRQRRLLAVLLADAGEMMSAHRVAELVLGRPASRAAASTLQSHVSVLRRALGPAGAGRIVTHPTGYGFRPASDDGLDGRRFEAAVAAARAALAAGNADLARRGLDAALLLWRGSPLPELEDVFELQGTIVRLEELRLTALELRADALLALGQPGAVAADLDDVARRHPLREGLWERLILALYRAGRQSEALRTFQTLRVALARDLGIDPGPVLRRLQEDILAQSPTLDRAPPRPAPAPSDSGFVGRDPELAAAQRAVDRAAQGHGSLLLLAGGPGMGKTRLAAELARRAAPAAVAWGAATPETGAPPLWPWIQALRSVLGGEEADRARWVPDPAARRDLDRLLSLRGEADDPDAPAPPARQRGGWAGPSFAGEGLPAGGAASGWDADEARFRLFDTVSQALRRRAATGPLIVVLDDLHWGDPSSLRLLCHVAAELQGSPVVLVATYRNQPGDLGGPLTDALGALARVIGREQLELGPLSSPEIDALVRARAATVPTESARQEIERLSGGVPFFVSELAQRVGSDGTLASGVPAGAQDALRFRLKALPAPVTGVLELAAVHGFAFDPDDLGRVDGVGPDEVRAALARAEGAALVGPTRDSTGRWEFCHHLVRFALLEMIAAPRRAELHLAVGRSLDAKGGVAADRLVHHFLEAADVGGSARAIELCEEAAAQAVEATGYEEAVALLETAVGLSRDRPGENGRTVELLLALGDARWQAQDAEGARETFLVAGERAAACGRGDQLARAALGYGGTTFSVFYVQTGVVLPRHIELLRRALDTLDSEDSPLRAMALAQLGVALYWSPDEAGEAAAASEAALAMARRIGDDGVLVPVLVNRILAAWGPDTLGERLAFPAEIAAIGSAAGNLRTEWAGVAMAVPGVLENGDPGTVDSLLGRADAILSRAPRARSRRTMLAVFRACLSLFRGELDRSEELVMEAHRLGEQCGDLDALQILGVHLAMLRRDQGRIAEMVPALEQQSQAFPAVPTWRIALALGLCDLGRTDAATAAIAGAGAPEDLPRDFQYLCGLAMWAEVAAALGDGVAGAAIVARLAPYQGRNILTSTAIAAWGSSDRYIGLAAAAAGDLELAETHLRHAVDHNRRMGARPWELRSQRDLARVLRRSGGVSRHAEATRLDGECLSGAVRIGMAALVE